MKTWIEVHEGEKFTDNTVIDNCKQCKTCLFRDGGTDYSNEYRKSSCAIYVYPDMKPIEVIRNTGQCELYEKDPETD
jgi:hypothetical protein